jgi:hypothetical protein
MKKFLILKIITKKYLKKKFPNFYKILQIFYTNILKKKKSSIKFYGWGLTMETSPPWMISFSKNKTYQVFENTKKKLDEKIINKNFSLTQIEDYYENLTFQDIFDHYEGLRYRNYIVCYSALIAFENTKSRNIVECGVADGMTSFFSISVFKEDKNYKAYLYDAWDHMRGKELVTESDKKRINNYKYLDIEITKNNLNEFNNNIIYNKGYIPEIFSDSINPDNLSWLHIDLNSSMPTLETLNFFYPKLENNGVILLDDYAFDSYEDTAAVVEDFFKDKNIHFLHLMTGQALIIKKS